MPECLSAPTFPRCQCKAQSLVTPEPSQRDCAGVCASTIELSPKTLNHLVPAREEAQLELVPEGIEAFKAEVRVLRLQSSLLKSVPDWIGELECLVA